MPITIKKIFIYGLLACIQFTGASNLPAEVKDNDSRMSSAIESAKKLVFGTSSNYKPDTAALANAQYQITLAIALGYDNGYELLERIVCLRAQKDGANLIFKFYNNAAKNGDITALARLYVMYKDAIYTASDPKKAREYFFKLRDQTSKEVLREQIFLAFLYYGKNQDAILWQSTAINANNVLKYIDILDASNYEIATMLLYKNLNEEIDPENKARYALAISQLYHLGGKYVESLKIANEFRDFAIFRKYAELYFAMADADIVEDLAAKNFWFTVAVEEKSDKKLAFKSVAKEYQKLNIVDAQKKALDFFLKTKDLGDIESTLEAAKILESPKTPVSDISKAEKLYLQVIEKSKDASENLKFKVQAQTRLFKIYILGLSAIPKNKNKAISILKDMALENSPDALARLYVYNCAKFIEEKTPKEQYLEKLKTLNLEPGQVENLIANTIRETRIETKKLMQNDFFDWLKKSADLGNASAQYKLAIQYISEGKDVELIKSLILKSAQSGNLSALAFIYSNLLEGSKFFEKDTSTAKLIYRSMLFRYKAKEVNTSIARCYERAMGVEKNIKKSRFFSSQINACKIEMFEE